MYTPEYYKQQIFKFPPYQRHIPWRCDADYEVAIVSPVGVGPKGDPGDALAYENLSDADKLDLAEHLIDAGILKGDKGDTGDPGASAYEIAVDDGFEGTDTEWIASLRQYPALSDPDKIEMKSWLTNELSGETIENMVANEIAQQSGSIATYVSDSVCNIIYPVGSIYMQAVVEGATLLEPGQMFGGTWTRIEDRFLLAAGELYEFGDTGGEASHVLTPAETAQKDHTHTLSNHTHSVNIGHGHGFTQPTVSGGYTASAITGGSHTHQLRRQTANKTMAKGTAQWDEGYVSGSSTITNGTATASSTHTHNLPSHSHSVSGGKVTDYSGSKTSGAPSTNATGGLTEVNGAAHNNMPPYTVVRVWKRVA